MLTKTVSNALPVFCSRSAGEDDRNLLHNLSMGQEQAAASLLNDMGNIHWLASCPRRLAHPTPSSCQHDNLKQRSLSATKAGSTYGLSNGCKLTSINWGATAVPAAHVHHAQPAFTSFQKFVAQTTNKSKTTDSAVMQHPHFIVFDGHSKQGMSHMGIQTLIQNIKNLVITLLLSICSHMCQNTLKHYPFTFKAKAGAIPSALTDQGSSTKPDVVQQPGERLWGVGIVHHHTKKLL